MSRRNDAVVVTGVGIVCGLGSGKARVLAGIAEGRSGIERVRSFDATGLRSDIASEVKDLDLSRYFEGTGAEDHDRCAQLAIAAASEALQESGLPLDGPERAGVGVALGTCNGGLLSLEHQRTLDPAALDPKQLARFPFYVQAEAVARHFKVGGPVVTLNTACAASGNAIGLAVDLIRKGYARAMLAGGADAMSMLVYAGFNALQALNPAPCSPYSLDHGLTLGEAGGFLVLETEESARARGAHIYAEVCGYGLSNDAYHPTAPDPDGRGIAFALGMGLRQAGVRPEEVGYVNTHGTGTKANDAAELRGLRAALGEHFARTPVSSTKPYFGHTLGAAAVVEYISTLLPLQADLLPATLHFRAFREGCEGTQLVANAPRPGKPTYFLCNNAAFGGHNVSLVSRNPKRGPAPRPVPPP
ncbi:beta-ketoacyl-[acyl-carrier-protein] synthase family protein, partial [Pyxidicoccus sp. 3LG]